MRILILNWRDIKNPKGGGAEILTHEMAKRWVSSGHKVTQFSAIFDGGSDEETIDGVKIIRQGHSDIRFHFSSVHYLAYKYYKNNKGTFDIVIDEIHGLPFFTNFYVKRNVILICEVAEELWVKMFGIIFGSIGKLVETTYLKLFYKNTPYLTISNSTRAELIKKGVNAENITVLPMGLTIPKKIKKFEKEKKPTLIFVGRLSKSKGVEDAIIAFGKILKARQDARFWIVGDGEKDYINRLREVARKLDVLNKITFWGFVSNEKKFELMARAQILVAPSVKEGWGLIVPEAGLVGTPAIGYNVPGLKDAIRDGENGVIVSKNNPSEIAKETIALLKDKKNYQRIRVNARKTSLSYNWDNTARVALKVLRGHD